MSKVAYCQGKILEASLEIKDLETALSMLDENPQVKAVLIDNYNQLKGKVKDLKKVEESLKELLPLLVKEEHAQK